MDGFAQHVATEQVGAEGKGIGWRRELRAHIDGVGGDARDHVGEAHGHGKDAQPREADSADGRAQRMDGP